MHHTMVPLKRQRVEKSSGKLLKEPFTGNHLQNSLWANLHKHIHKKYERFFSAFVQLTVSSDRFRTQNLHENPYMKSVILQVDTETCTGYCIPGTPSPSSHWPLFPWTWPRGRAPASGVESCCGWTSQWRPRGLPVRNNHILLVCLTQIHKEVFCRHDRPGRLWCTGAPWRRSRPRRVKAWSDQPPSTGSKSPSLSLLGPWRTRLWLRRVSAELKGRKRPQKAGIHVTGRQDLIKLPRNFLMMALDCLRASARWAGSNSSQSMTSIFFWSSYQRADSHLELFMLGSFNLRD